MDIIRFNKAKVDIYLMARREDLDINVLLDYLNSQKPYLEDIERLDKIEQLVKSLTEL